MAKKDFPIEIVEKGPLFSLNGLGSLTVLVDKDTGVLYLGTYVNGSISVIPLRDPDGRPKLIGRQYRY